MMAKEQINPALSFPETGLAIQASYSLLLNFRSVERGHHTKRLSHFENRHRVPRLVVESEIEALIIWQGRS